MGPQATSWQRKNNNNNNNHNNLQFHHLMFFFNVVSYQLNTVDIQCSPDPC